MIRRLFFGLFLATTLCSCGGVEVSALSDKEELGLLIFTDSTLSMPAGQSCASCHEVGRGFADPEKRAISEGVVKGRFAKRNSPTVAYARFVPPLSYDSVEEVYVGGLFLDGRVANLTEQAADPFIDMLEMANSRQGVVHSIRKAPYFAKLQAIYGQSNDADSIFHYVTDALAAYQSSDVVSPFSSKFDDYLAGRATLTPDELRGKELFEDVEKGMCAECHPLTPDPLYGRVLFTDHTYDNLGVPRNEKNPYYTQPLQFNSSGRDFVDLGLGDVLKNSDEDGKFRVPTLRNIALTAPYGHNGYFATLEDIVHFYNVRDVDTTGKFGAAEYPFTVNVDELGNLGLTPEEERQIVTFLHTLTDK